MTPEQFDAIVAGFYDAAAQRLSWSAALDRAADGLDAHAIDLMGADKPSYAIAFHHGGGRMGPQARLDFVRVWRARYPATQKVRAMPLGEWFHDHEQFDDAFVGKEPFFQEFLIPHGGRFVSSTKLFETSDRDALLSVTRDAEQGPLGAAAIADLERLRGHMVRALEANNHLRSSEPLPLPGSELLDQFSRPMVLVDESCHILHVNGAGRTFLDAGDPVVDRHGVITLRQPEDDRRLKQAVSRPSGLVSSVADPRRIINARRVADSTVVTVLVLSVGNDAAVAGFGSAASAVLTFVDPYAARPLDASLVAQAFDLTPAESRVGIQLAQGQTIEKIATNNGVSMATVRTQLKSLFAKTGTNRQADLVRLITTLPEIGPSSGDPSPRPGRKR